MVKFILGNLAYLTREGCSPAAKARREDGSTTTSTMMSAKTTTTTVAATCNAAYECIKLVSGQKPPEVLASSTESCIA